MESKKLGGNMRSNLYSTMGISSSKRFMSSSVMTIAVKSFKKMLNSIKACHTFAGNNSRNAVGINLCIKI